MTGLTHADETDAREDDAENPLRAAADRMRPANLDPNETSTHDIGEQRDPEVGS